MSSSGLLSLTIEHLRGSTLPFALPFEKGKKLTVVYGENGTGKSTICDAFELLGKGKVGSLDDRGLGKTGRYWPTLGKNAADVAVALETVESVCKATLAKGYEVVATPPGARPRVEVFRKRQILSLIAATPADRYSSISRFIDVSGVESSEGLLRDLIRDLKNNREVAVTRLQENEDTIRQFWQAAGSPAIDPFAWASAEAARDTSEFDAEVAALAALRAAYSRLTDYPERLTSAEQELASARSNAVAATAAAAAILERVAEGADELVGILEAARRYLSKYPGISECPLCESSAKIEELAPRIDARLGALGSLRAAQEGTRAAERQVLGLEQRLASLKDGAVLHARAFEECRARYVWSADVPLPGAPAPNDPTLIAPWLASTGQLPDVWARAEAAKGDKRQFIATLRQALVTWRDNTRDQEELARLLPRLEKALAIVEEERRRCTDAILSSIASEVGRLYEAVHPGEGLSKISLELDPKRRASLEMGAEFCGLATPPQAYFSDSHLDTLGLCVFLALSALDQPSETILVLDDVLASVDEPHVDRLIEMLYAETIKFRHCVITTHYRPWKQKLRWGWLQAGQCQFVELAHWTPADGLRLIRSIPDIERLRALLAESPVDPQLVCAKAGVILEAALDFITMTYECAVPRRPGSQHTLGDLLPAVSRKLRQALRVDVLKGQDASGAPVYDCVGLAPFLDEVERIAQARNVFGCHFSELSFDLLDTDAIGFGQQVLNLVEQLLDTEAGWPRNKKSGEYWATAGETRRLRPLIKPA